MRKYFTLSSYFQDHMVFQANKPIKIFGKCKKHVEINVSFLDQEKKFKTTDNHFVIELSPVDYQSKGFSFTITSKKQKMTIYNCVVGDVYLFLGSKNLHQTIEESAKTKDYDSDDIRFLNINHGNKWIKSSRASLTKESLLGYLFAKHFHMQYKVPMGIIVYSDPNENIFSWLNKKAVLSNIDLKNYINGAFQKNDMTLSKDYEFISEYFKYLYIKSLVFYQGENDFSHYHFYEKALRHLIKTYRLIFKDVYLPFYLIQMSSFEGNKEHKIASSEIRIAQSSLASDKNHAYLVSVVDIDEIELVSMNKNILSTRLANTILEKQYRKAKNTICPQIFSYKIRENQVDIYTHQNYLSLISRSGQKMGFYALNRNADYYPLKDVSINHNLISVKISKDIREIRYAYDDNPTCDIFTSNGLPLLPFKINLAEASE